MGKLSGNADALAATFASALRSIDMVGKPETGVVVALASFLATVLGILATLTASNHVLRIVLILLLCVSFLVGLYALLSMVGWVLPVIHWVRYWAGEAFYWAKDLIGRLPRRRPMAAAPQPPPLGFAWPPPSPGRPTFTPAPQGRPDSPASYAPSPSGGPVRGPGVSTWDDEYKYQSDTPVGYPSEPPSNVFDGESKPRPSRGPQGLPPPRPQELPTPTTRDPGLSLALALVTGFVRLMSSGASSRRHDPDEHIRDEEKWLCPSRCRESHSLPQRQERLRRCTRSAIGDP
jgi:hypothetical protein